MYYGCGMYGHTPTQMDRWIDGWISMHTYTHRDTERERERERETHVYIYNRHCVV